MSTRDKNGWKTKVAALLPIATLGGTAYWLLATQQKFDGGNAIMLFLIGCVASLFIYYGERIEIIKAFGAELKFKRLAEQAEDTIEKLEASRLFLFKSAIQTITSIPQSKMMIFGDDRVHQYQELVKEVKNQGIYESLREVIAQGAWLLMEHQHVAAESHTELYHQREGDNEVVFRMLNPEELIDRAKEAELKANSESMDDPTAEHIIRAMVKDMPILLDIYNEANKSPSE